MMDVELAHRMHLRFLCGLGQFQIVPRVDVQWRSAKYLCTGYVPDQRLRTILDCEVVMEFDGTWHSGGALHRAKAEELMECSVLRLAKGGFHFIVFTHEGKSPHLHLFIPELAKLSKDERRRYKAAFLRKYAPEPDLVDTSLAGEHLIALEYAPHWKHRTVKREVLSRLNLMTVTPDAAQGCARCDLKPCSFVDARGFFYCEFCAKAALDGVLK